MSLTKNNNSDNFYPKEIAGTDWHCDYLFSTHRGCPLDCLYCSSKRFNVRFGGDPTIPKKLKSAWFGYSGNLDFLKKQKFAKKTYFVNPYCDIFALPKSDVDNWIIPAMLYCNYEYGSKFILQTKNPSEYFNYIQSVTRSKDFIPQGSWIGTTIETDDYYGLDINKAPSPYERYQQMWRLSQWIETHADNTVPKFKIFITIEPVMKHSLFTMVRYMRRIFPSIIFIGANTSKVELPEPTESELIELIEGLKDAGLNVYLKSNIRRLIPDYYDGWKLAEE